jgi:predicted amidohydrolase
MKLALAQLLVEGTEPERNFERANRMVAQAKALDCDFVLLPETIDFGWTHPDSLTEAHFIPGDFSEILCNMAKAHSIWICVGLTERTHHGNYNTALIIDNYGNIIGKHRKINLLNVEFPFYQVGQKLEVFDTPFGKIGLNICADNYLESLDIGHALARMGAQLIIAPSSWTVDNTITEVDDPYRDKWIKPLSILATTHGLIIASATSVGYIVGGPYEGKKMVGCSLCIGPEGILAQGVFNEFAGELITVNFQMPQRIEKGVEIGEKIIRMKNGFQ